MNRLSVTGILQLKYDNEVHIDVPENLIPLKKDDLHVTLLKLKKEDRKKVKEYVSTLIDADIPDVRFSHGFVVRRDDKESYAAVVHEQLKLRTFVDSIIENCGLEVSDYDKNRPFHISLANLTGSPFDSVGDPTVDELHSTMWYVQNIKNEISNDCHKSMLTIVEYSALMSYYKCLIDADINVGSIRWLYWPIQGSM